MKHDLIVREIAATVNINSIDKSRWSQRSIALSWRRKEIVQVAGDVRPLSARPSNFGAR